MPQPGGPDAGMSSGFASSAVGALLLSMQVRPALASCSMIWQICAQAGLDHLTNTTCFQTLLVSPRISMLQAYSIGHEPFGMPPPLNSLPKGQLQTFLTQL